MPEPFKIYVVTFNGELVEKEAVEIGGKVYTREELKGRQILVEVEPGFHRTPADAIHARIAEVKASYESYVAKLEGMIPSQP